MKCVKQAKTTAPSDLDHIMLCWRDHGVARGASPLRRGPRRRRSRWATAILGETLPPSFLQTNTGCVLEGGGIRRNPRNNNHDVVEVTKSDTISSRRVSLQANSKRHREQASSSPFPAAPAK